MRRFSTYIRTMPPSRRNRGVSPIVNTGPRTAPAAAEVVLLGDVRDVQHMTALQAVGRAQTPHLDRPAADRASFDGPRHRLRERVVADHPMTIAPASAGHCTNFAKLKMKAALTCMSLTGPWSSGTAVRHAGYEQRKDPREDQGPGS